MNFILRWLSCAIAVGIAVWLVPGIYIVGGTSAWLPITLCALFMALINVSIKPILQILSLPISVLTLGIFAIIINALMLELAGWLSVSVFGEGIQLASFGAAFLGSIIVSIVSAIVNSIFGVQ